ncbi:hypothetical protein GF354_06020 [Candidatus Peregrinibacteria bacterium]|nr:hypothetical protein [Candidatus Peregrinibacteria bacterium]
MKKKSNLIRTSVTVVLVVAVVGGIFYLFNGQGGQGFLQLRSNEDDSKLAYHQCYDACLVSKGEKATAECEKTCLKDPNSFLPKDEEKLEREISESETVTEEIEPMPEPTYETGGGSAVAPETGGGIAEASEAPIGPDEEVVAKAWINLSHSYGDETFVGEPMMLLGGFSFRAVSDETVRLNNVKFTIYRDEDGTLFDSINDRNQNSGADQLFDNVYLFWSGSSDPIKMTTLSVENDRVVAEFNNLYLTLEPGAGAISLNVYADVKDDAPIGDDLDGVALVLKSVNDIDVEGYYTDYTGVRFDDYQEDSQNINGTYYQYISN